MPLGAHRHGAVPAPLSRAGCSRQFGRASMIPHRVQTMRGPNFGTGTWSGHGSAFKIARWWHSQQHTSSDRTPLARMLPSVIGGPAWDRGRVLMGNYRGHRAGTHQRTAAATGIVPKCQGAAAREWLAEREPELLAVPYFHVVYTLPAPISDIAYTNKAVIYDLLFSASAETTPPLSSRF
jgi:hypothetical protein